MRVSRLRILLPIAALVSVLGFSSSASAFSVVVHVYLANAIHDELARNMAATGLPIIRLMQQDGSVVRVTLDDDDARAILDNPQFFRGGAIGPDNTVMTGLTDPSHAWFFSPFQQCDALYREAVNEEGRQMAGGVTAEDLERSERAYALGCYLHGITDNNAHHVVNFFTGETFTLYPVDAAVGGELQFSLLNVVRHIVTETKFQESLEDMEQDFDSIDRQRQGVMRDPLTTARLEHRIAVDLVIRVYFDGGDDGDTDLWDSYTAEHVEAKIEALRIALGVAPGAGIIETLMASTDPFDDDVTAVSAYVDFLRTGGLAPADYILLLPEIVRDVRSLYMIVNAQGIARGQGSDAGLIERNLLKNAFAPRDAFGEDDWMATNPSRFEDVMTVKFRELDSVMPAYVEAVQGISNLNIMIGLQNATRAEREAAIQPLVDVLSRITDINYGILFSEPTMIITENVSAVTAALDAIVDLIKMRVREFIIEAAMVYLDELKAEFDRVVMRVLDRIDERILRTYEDLILRVDGLRDAAVDEARREALDRVGLDLRNGGGPFDGFLDSVLYMNAFNSTAVVLARRDGVLPTGSGMFDGPASFDASFQVDYNQFALCSDIRQHVYPCGISVGEMLQTDFRSCAQLDEIADLFQPSVECHMGDRTMFSAPSPSSCAPTMFEDFNTGGGDGSYTLAFPPEYTDVGPTACYLDTMDLDIMTGGPPDIPDSGLPPGVDGGPPGIDPTGDDGGCSCSSTEAGRTNAAPVLLALLFLWLRKRMIPR